ncbi:8-amino-7-oxononanoate synthase [Flavivirga aquatica]|uniref:8-amino-7-oxononanoate synthase n=1 Tax=Flavivirga aquatica TaxID=1849968 RepID=A0A1E5TDJ6_9FLAO|nr:pyridoxal phosphate-dependent aminotransferase family protein [Flavivirga aquatica]OEK09417.1 8-amino-7-oxononanoate synthase [Flavivirga aquatica]
MKSLPKILQQKLEERKANNALRKLGVQHNLIDFSSNDYLGFSKNEVVFNKAHEFLIENNMPQNGATGSRLLSGNHKLYNSVETVLCNFHKSESALVFNSGYDANVGFFSSVPQRGDIILYDEYIHASIRDGISMSHAKGYKFKHNNLEALEHLILRHSNHVSETHKNIYIITESVFSMDGDSPDLVKFSEISKKYNSLLIVDEAHAIGVLGKQGAGLIADLGLEKDVFARIITFGKAMGCHGAAILSNESLKQYLVNFSRSFIYTTALPPHSLATIYVVYNELLIISNVAEFNNSIQELHKNIQFFKAEIIKNKLESIFIESHSAIHCCVISGNDKVKVIAKRLQEKRFDVKPILSPTVPKGQERLRFCLHAFNTEKEISEVLKGLATFVV